MNYNMSLIIINYQYKTKIYKIVQLEFLVNIQLYKKILHYQLNLHNVKSKAIKMIKDTNTTCK